MHHGHVHVQVLQMYYPPQHPPITELARDELKLAGEGLVALWNQHASTYNGLEPCTLAPQWPCKVSTREHAKGRVFSALYL